MDTKNYEQLLLEHGIKPTANRITVVKALEASMLPQSMAELQNRIDTIDKSGIFRTLQLFREHHLVHVIDGAVDGQRFELCHSHHDDLWSHIFHKSHEFRHYFPIFPVRRKKSIVYKWSCPIQILLLPLC